ncbi:polysaccharide biosynthesis/export family protein [Megalodesulfovibrio paquesii]
MTAGKFVAAWCIAVVMVLSCSAAVQAKDYIIAPGDQLAIVIPEEPDFSGTAIVRPDGKITLSYIGEAEAAGKTPEQLSQELKDRLKQYFTDPQVKVAVAAPTNDAVFVIGGGVKSALFEIRTRRTLLELLAALGDLNTVDLAQARLIRDNREIARDFTTLYEQGNASANLPLAAHDIVFLPPAKDANVYVVGAVEKPATLTWHGGMTFLDAVLAVGGFNKFASPDSSRIVRTRDGKQETIPVKGEKLVEKGDMTQNIPLMRGDMIIVEESFF